MHILGFKGFRLYRDTLEMRQLVTVPHTKKDLHDFRLDEMEPRLTVGGAEAGQIALAVGGQGPKVGVHCSALLWHRQYRTFS